ncbi:MULTISPECIES: phage tail domain-containing protein [unclassified Microbacterium]|uniref:phage tail domain-containing protein n=1 Tax=Microbacterium TaxID=33882 RepID=UPI003B9F0957
MTTATCEGIEFETRPRNRRHAYLIDPQAFATWRGGGDVRREVVPRPGRHGSYYADGWLDSKVVPIKGHILAESQEDFEEMRRNLEGFLVGRTAKMVVAEDDGITTYGTVGLSRQALVTPYGGDSYAGTFLVEVWSEDPIRYAVQPNRFGPATSVTVSHRGTVDAPALLRVTGAPSSYTVTSDLGTYTVSGITAGGTHEIDLSTGWVYRDGALVQGVGSGDVWEIPPGLPGVVHTTSAGQLTVIVPDAYG